jgi:hypothetical protein
MEYITLTRCFWRNPPLGACRMPEPSTRNIFVRSTVAIALLTLAPATAGGVSTFNAYHLRLYNTHTCARVSLICPRRCG